MKQVDDAATLSVAPEWRQSIFAGYNPATQSIRVPASQDHIHNFLRGALFGITGRKPSKDQKSLEIRFIAAM